MDLNESVTVLEVPARVRQSAITLLLHGGVGSATVPTMCEAAGITEDEFREHFQTPSDVFVSIVGTLLDAHVGNVDATIQRRRSLTDSMQIAMRAFWDLVELHIEEHHALLVLMLAQAGDPELVRNMGFSVHDTYLRSAEAWLTEVEQIHAITWEMPVPRLALLMQASFDGLMVEYAASGDGAEIRQLLDILAFQLSQHGRRASKNQPH